MPASIKQVVDDIFHLYEKYGAEEYIGEPVSQLEHMSQSAQLALQAGFEDEVVLAAFFHDIGHMCAIHKPALRMGKFGVKSHEKIGADFVRGHGFPEKVAQLVESHVSAKRYLTFKHPEYYDQLSDASKKTLEYQGGRMTEHEASLYETDPLFELSIMMRKWDEKAKEISVPVIDIQILRTIAEKVLSGENAQRETISSGQSRAPD